MILFPLYIAAIWIPAFVHRRRPLGFFIALLGPAPLLAFAWLVGLLLPQAKLATQSWWLFMYGSISVALAGGGLLIACAPRRAKAHQCAQCHYDLRGNVTGVCPECGRSLDGGADGPGVEEPDGVIPASPASTVPNGPRAA